MGIYDASPEAIEAIKNSEDAENEKTRISGIKYTATRRDNFLIVHFLQR